MTTEDSTPTSHVIFVLGIIERLAKIIAIVAIPIVIPLALAFYSADVQKGAQRETINRDYVQLAVSILKESKTNGSPELRNWAVDLLSEHSPTKFDAAVITQLKNGQTVLPGSAVALLHRSRVVAISADAKTIAVAETNEVALKDILTGKQMGALKQPNSHIVGMDFSEDGRYLVVADYSGAVSIWDWKLKMSVATMKVPQPLSTVKFSAQGNIQAFTVTGGVSIYDVSGKEMRTIFVPGSPSGLSFTVH